MTSILTGIGLTLNIIGTLLIWKFGLPEPVDKTGASILVADQSDPTEVRRAKTYNRYSVFGVMLLVLGFLLQLIAVLV